MDELIYPRYRWFVFITLCVVQAVAAMVTICPATMIGEISRSMGIDMGVATQITMVAMNVSIGIAALLGGRIIDRFGASRVWAVCSVLLIIGSLLIPMIGSTIQGMLIIRLVQGFGAGPMMATAALVAAQWFPPNERGTVIGFQGAGVSVGSMASLILVPFLFQKTGSWQTALSWLAVFFGITLILSTVISLGPEPPAAETGAPQDLPEGSESNIKRALKLPATWAGCTCILWFMWSVGIFNQLITNYLAVNPPVGVGLGSMKAGSIMAGANLLFTIAAMLSGVILEKVFRGRIRELVMLGFILPAVLWPAAKFTVFNSSILILSACLWVGAFGIALTINLVMTFFAKSYPKDIMGKLGGLLVVFNIAGNIIGTAAGSYGLTLTGSYNIAFGLIGASALLGFLTAILLKEPTVFYCHPDELGAHLKS